MAASSNSIATRLSTDQLAFGRPTQLPMNVLPTELDTAKSFLHEKHKWIIETSAIKEPNNSFIADIVVSQVESVYKRASIPTVRKDTIKPRVLKVYEKRKSIMRIPTARMYNNQECPDSNDLSGFFRHKEDMFLNGISCLFEVVDNENVPKIEREFLVDQRTVRKVTINNTVDKEATRKQQQRESGKKAEDDRTPQERQLSQVQHVVSGSVETDENDDETTGEMSSLRRHEYNSDSDFQMEPSTSSSGTAIVVKVDLKNRGRDLGQIAEAKVRNLTSDRAMVTIVNVTLRTYNIPEILDKSKVRRAVAAVLEEAEVTPTALCGGIGYDGRKYVTL